MNESDWMIRVLREIAEDNTVPAEDRIRAVEMAIELLP